MPVGPDAQDLQVDPAGVGDGGVVACARAANVGGQAVGPVHRAGGEVDPSGELVPDDVQVALGMFGGQADVLVEREGRGPGEGESPVDVAPDQLVIDRQGAG